MNVTLTEDQAKIVVQLIDIAVKAGGLNNAIVALPIAQEIEKQLVKLEKEA